MRHLSPRLGKVEADGMCSLKLAQLTKDLAPHTRAQNLPWVHKSFGLGTHHEIMAHLGSELISAHLGPELICAQNSYGHSTHKGSEIMWAQFIAGMESELM